MVTISAPADIDRLFTSGKRAGSPTLLVLVAQTPEARDPHHGRVLFVAGKKIGPAVFRNRCKRVMRDAVRRAGGPWDGWDVALVARRATAHAAPTELDRALGEALGRLGVRP